jgi:class 3 adenylate cyclase
VEKFIGDAVMALFGAPAAHEDDPERAVRAALAIRDWVREE